MRSLKPLPSDTCNLSRSRPRCPPKLSLKLTARLNGTEAVAAPAAAPLGVQAAPLVAAEATVPLTATVVAAALATAVMAATQRGAVALVDMAAAPADMVVTEAMPVAAV